MRLTDGKKTVEITMTKWNGSGWDPDWSADFFDAGTLKYDQDKDAYVVDDVDYCVEQAEDCIACRGDYADNIPDPDAEVRVEEI